MEKVETEEPQFWIQTYANVKFDLVNPKPEQINIVDIYHALSQITRFNGHCQRQYSVAQHSLTLAAVLEKEGHRGDILLKALLHDAHEAYIGDLTQPFKAMLLHCYDVDINKIAEKIQRQIHIRFGLGMLTPVEQNIIKNYDLACLRTEVYSLFEFDIDNWASKINVKLKDSIKEVLPPHVSKELFRKTFHRYYNNNTK